MTRAWVSESHLGSPVSLCHTLQSPDPLHVKWGSAGLSGLLESDAREAPGTKLGTRIGTRSAFWAVYGLLS